MSNWDGSKVKEWSPGVPWSYSLPGRKLPARVKSSQWSPQEKTKDCWAHGYLCLSLEVAPDFPLGWEETEGTDAGAAQSSCSFTRPQALAGLSALRLSSSCAIRALPAGQSSPHWQLRG